MVFILKKWDAFCKNLAEQGRISVPASYIAEGKIKGEYLILKHDIETNVDKAFRMAVIENKYGHKGSYYVQAYLLNDRKNIHILKKMQKMGHEISYHYDVMDACRGDIEQAMIEFGKNLAVFKKEGFRVVTVCQHGNPVIERIGYHSNRDFFRNEKIQRKYFQISDIMVDFKIKADTEYRYFSDAGRKFKFIYDPINNDIIDSENKNILFNDLDNLMNFLNHHHKNSIISTHPHRWTSSAFEYIIRTFIFNTAKKIAKLVIKIPFMKKVMSKYYYLAKKL